MLYLLCSPIILSPSSFASKVLAWLGGSNGVLLLLDVFIVFVCACIYSTIAECGFGTVLCNWLPRTLGNTFMLALTKHAGPPFGTVFRKCFSSESDPSFATHDRGSTNRLFLARRTFIHFDMPRDWGRDFNLLWLTFSLASDSIWPMLSGSSFIKLCDISNFSSFTKCNNEAGRSLSLLLFIITVFIWKRRLKLSGRTEIWLWLRLMKLKWGRRSGISGGISVRQLNEMSILSYKDTASLMPHGTSKRQASEYSPLTCWK